MHLTGKAGEKEEKREKRKKPSKQRTAKVFTVKPVYGHDADKQSFWLKREYIYVWASTKLRKENEDDNLLKSVFTNGVIPSALSALSHQKEEKLDPPLVFPRGLSL